MKSFDVVGIGAGPANLSLAALSTKIKNINTILIEKRKEFIWHAGMLLPDAKLQVPFLNDLVTLADPTNPFSFLNFLSQNNRLYQFIAANFNPMNRSEFNQYLQWVFNQLENIKKGEEVLNVAFDGERLIVTTSKEKYQTKSLVLGTGQVPYIPEIFKNHISRQVYHNSRFMDYADNFKGRRVAIIGGGQSGAEIVRSVISEDTNLPNKIFWISRRYNFLPLDDTPFTNEIFTPKYIKYFHSIEESKKQQLIREQKLANQGISECTAKEIYQKMYELKFIKNYKDNFFLLPSHELITITKHNNEYELTITDLINGDINNITVDAIILSTGYCCKFPEFLSELQSMIDQDENGLKIDLDYKLVWQGTKSCSIYIQNGAQHTHGVSDSTRYFHAAKPVFGRVGLAHIAGMQAEIKLSGTEPHLEAVSYLFFNIYTFEPVVPNDFESQIRSGTHNQDQYPLGIFPMDGNKMTELEIIRKVLRLILDKMINFYKFQNKNDKTEERGKVEKNSESKINTDMDKNNNNKNTGLVKVKDKDKEKVKDIVKDIVKDKEGKELDCSLGKHLEFGRTVEENDRIKLNLERAISLNIISRGDLDKLFYRIATVRYVFNNEYGLMGLQNKLFNLKDIDGISPCVIKHLMSPSGLNLMAQGISPIDSDKLSYKELLEKLEANKYGPFSAIILKQFKMQKETPHLVSTHSFLKTTPIVPHVNVTYQKPQKIVI